MPDDKQDAGKHGSRRAFLKKMSAASVLVGGGFTGSAELLGEADLLDDEFSGDELSGEAPARPARQNPIAEENQREGTTDWQLTYVESQNNRSKKIEGYCSKTSVRPGETLDVFLSADPAASVTVDLYRMGYYGGTGGRLVTRLGPFEVSPQPDPPIMEHRLRECQWARAAQISIAEEWLSGVYLGKLSCAEHRYESYIIFVVRDDREADLLFQCSDATWQAYNAWPGNYSLYSSDPPGQPHSARTWVSFDRPYGKYPQGFLIDQPLSQGSGEFLCWEYPLCFWLEKHGYDVTYGSNLDTHEDPGTLERVACFLSVGHDEYWSLDMFDHVKEAVDDGLSAAFLCGNSVFATIQLDPSTAATAPRDRLTPDGQRIPVEPSPDGTPNRLMHRIGIFSGIRKEEGEAFDAFMDTFVGPFDLETPDESTLIGGRTMFPYSGAGDWIITQADHWLFEGTGIENGDRIPGIVGWEHHGDPADIPGLEVVAEGPTTGGAGGASTYAATVYPGPEGSWVFNAATIFWSLGLSDPPGLRLPLQNNGRPHGADERVQKITANFLEKCGIRPGQ